MQAEGSEREREKERKTDRERGRVGEMVQQFRALAVLVLPKDTGSVCT